MTNATLFLDCETERLVGYSPAGTVPSPYAHPHIGKRNQGRCANDTGDKAFVKKKNRL
jgi:hypothetical protein